MLNNRCTCIKICTTCYTKTDFNRVSHFLNANRRLPFVYSVLLFLHTAPSPTERCISTGVVEAAVACGEEGEEEAEVRGRARTPSRPQARQDPVSSPSPRSSPPASCSASTSTRRHAQRAGPHARRLAAAGALTARGRAHGS